MAEKLWLLETHPEYEAICERNTFVDDHYTGGALKKAREAARNLVIEEPRGRPSARDGEHLPVTSATGPRGLGRYLFRRAQGENVHNFDERARISKFPDDFAAIMDAHAGSVMGVESQAVRTWEDGVLGSPEDEGSTAEHLWENADGKGADYETLWAQAASGLARRRFWYQVDGPTDDYPWPRIIWLDPKAVRNWREESGIVVEAIVHETVDVRRDLTKAYEKAAEEQYIHYTVDGWGRYRVEGEGQEKREVLIEDGAYEIYASPERRRRMIPLGYIDLPLSRDVACSMAEGSNYLFNLSSDVRHILRVANHPKLAGNVEDTQWDNTMEALQEGNNVLQGDWSFISPPAENASVGYELYDKETKKYYHTSFEQMNDAAREATATEIKHDARGRVAWLTVLSRALDELENRVLFLLSQIVAPDKPQQWRGVTVTRSRDFAPLDPEALFTSRKTAFFGQEPLPTTNKIKAQVAADLHEMQGYELDEEDMTELEAVIERREADREGVQGAVAGSIQRLRQKVAG